jgi:acetolactate synthase-1/2/3 large subunit
MVKVSDIIADYLKEKNIETVFGIIGSANSHIFDSINKLGYTKIINTHHEQAAVMAMGAHYRASGKLSAAIVTAGGGVTNAVTGIVSNWADSIPGLIICGQESYNYVTQDSHLRMYGTQGLNISEMVKDVTKKALGFTNQDDIQEVLEDLDFITSTGRPGPCLLDVPFNLQSKMVEKRDWAFHLADFKFKSLNTESISQAIKESKRPVILGGNGIRLSGAKNKFNEFINKNKIPTLLTWSGIDLIESDNENFYGRFGLYGQRCANFIVQNADLVIVLGSRLALPQVGYDFSQFARDAKIIQIDIDELELAKYPTHMRIQANCKHVIESLNECDLDSYREDWVAYCNKLRQDYPWVEKAHKDNGYLNSYKFIDRLSNHLKDDHIIVTDMGTALLSGHQSIKLKKDQVMFTSLGLGEMGYGIAGAIGAQFACPNKPVLCLNCDGGIMMNLQELHTVIENELPIKVVIFNNDGYLMIKHTQKMLFKNHYVSVNKKTGIGLPNFSKLMPAFGYNYYELKDWQNFDSTIENFLNDKDASVLEVFMDPEQDFIPKVKGVLKEDLTIFPPPIEEMSPLLPLTEIENSMIIQLSEKSKQIKR